MNLKWLADHFQKVQLFIIGAALFIGWLNLRAISPKSKFKVREADRSDLDRLKQGPSTADAKMKKAAPPLALPGIVLHGEPHEILGIPENATEAEIIKAHKEAIKQYHPDRIQGKAKEQLQFYQEASIQINLAKEKLLAKLKR